MVEIDLRRYEVWLESSGFSASSRGEHLRRIRTFLRASGRDLDRLSVIECAQRYYQGARMHGRSAAAVNSIAMSLEQYLTFIGVNVRFGRVASTDRTGNGAAGECARRET
jgi:hypothetical protein